MLPSWNTLTNASGVKPDGGSQVTSGAAASVSVLKAVAVAQANGISHSTAMKAATTMAAILPTVSFLRGWRSLGFLAVVEPGAGRVRVGVAMAMRSCGG